MLTTTFNSSTHWICSSISSCLNCCKCAVRMTSIPLEQIYTSIFQWASRAFFNHIHNSVHASRVRLNATKFFLSFFFLWTKSKGVYVGANRRSQQLSSIIIVRRSIVFICLRLIYYQYLCGCCVWQLAIGLAWSTKRRWY